ncbi:hypothetical protein ACTFIW_005986 [Dictyostelium discoideum]
MLIIQINLYFNNRIYITFIDQCAKEYIFKALCFSYLFRSTSKSYQCLEYVGDSVLDFFVSDFLCTAFPDHRSLLVRISNLSSISRKLNLLPTLSKGIHDTLPIKNSVII